MRAISKEKRVSLYGNSLHPWPATQGNSSGFCVNGVFEREETEGTEDEIDSLSSLFPPVLKISLEDKKRAERYLCSGIGSWNLSKSKLKLELQRKLKLELQRKLNSNRSAMLSFSSPHQTNGSHA
jgi:hypothetical protein